MTTTTTTQDAPKNHPPDDRDDVGDLEPAWEVDVELVERARITVRAPSREIAAERAKSAPFPVPIVADPRPPRKALVHAQLDGPLVEIAFFDLSKNAHFFSLRRRFHREYPDMPEPLREHVLRLLQERLPLTQRRWWSEHTLCVRLEKPEDLAALDLGALLDAINAPYAGCRVYTNGSDYMIASNVEEASKHWVDTYGPRDADDTWTWTIVAPDEPIGIWCNAQGEPTEIGEGECLRLPAHEWIARLGRGPLCSMEG